MKRKVKITFEIEELTYFKSRRRLTAFCGHCGVSVELLTAENAAQYLGLSEFQIFRLIETGNVHFAGNDEVYLCQKSLEIWAELLRIYLEKQETQFFQNRKTIEIND